MKFGKPGKEFEIEYKIEVFETTDTLYADGWNIPTKPKKEIYEKKTFKMGEVEGDRVHICTKDQFCSDHPDLVNKIPEWANNRNYVICTIDRKNYRDVYIFISDETKSEIDAYIESVRAQSAEYQAKKREETEKKVKHAKYIIEKAEKQSVVRCAADEAKWRKEYNNVMNEGGDGYVPQHVTLEELEEAKKIIAEYEIENEKAEAKTVTLYKGFNSDKLFGGWFWSIEPVSDGWERIESFPYEVEIPEDFSLKETICGDMMFFKAGCDTSYNLAIGRNCETGQPYLIGGDPVEWIKLRVIREIAE